MSETLGTLLNSLTKAIDEKQEDKVILEILESIQNVSLIHLWFLYFLLFYCMTLAQRDQGRIEALLSSIYIITCEIQYGLVFCIKLVYSLIDPPLFGPWQLPFTTHGRRLMASILLQRKKEVRTSKEILVRVVVHSPKSTKRAATKSLQTPTMRAKIHKWTLLTKRKNRLSMQP